MRIKLGGLRKLFKEIASESTEAIELLSSLDPLGNRKDREDGKAFIQSLSRAVQLDLMRPETVEMYPGIPSVLVACMGLTFMQNTIFLVCVDDPTAYTRLPEKYRQNVPNVMANRGSRILSSLFMNDVANVGVLTQLVQEDPSVSSDLKKNWYSQLGDTETFRRLVPREYRRVT
jgi:hypothetical protein